MEPNRSSHDPVVEIFGNLITPGVRYSAEAYDLANRRWYRLDVTEPDVPHDDWLSVTVAGHIRTYYAAHGEVPPWNTITLPDHDGPAAFESRRDGLVRPAHPGVALLRRVAHRPAADGADPRAAASHLHQPLGGPVCLARPRLRLQARRV